MVDTFVHTNMCPHRRHELEVFMPPRSKILPQTMQDGYRNSQVSLAANNRGLAAGIAFTAQVML